MSTWAVYALLTFLFLTFVTLVMLVNQWQRTNTLINELKLQVAALAPAPPTPVPSLPNVALTNSGHTMFDLPLDRIPPRPVN